MFSIGFGEILVIGVIALLVIGPKQLPEVARVVGRLFGEVKKATEDLSGGLLSATKEVLTAMDDATQLKTEDYGGGDHGDEDHDGHHETDASIETQDDEHHNG